MFRFLIFVVSIVLILLVFAFTLENLEPININFLIQQVQAPLGVVMLICFVVGAIVGILFSSGMILRNRNRAKQLEKKIAMTEQEVANLRQLPIKSSH